MPGEKFVLSGIILVVWVAGVWIGGGCGPIECAESLTDQVTSVEGANYSPTWTTPGNDHMTVVLTGPYELLDGTADALTAVLRDQAGIEAAVVIGPALDIPSEGVLDANDVMWKAYHLAEAYPRPVVVVAKVSETDAAGGGYRGYSYVFDEANICVVTLHWNVYQGYPFLNAVEGTILVHEIGHWLEVPARPFHQMADEPNHCSSGNCVMFHSLNACAVFANLTGGIPQRFCDYCAAELAEMTHRREQASAAERAEEAKCPDEP